ncbi:MAG: class I adenylate-forming enzyme family protein [Candidatus Acidiferrum sp.]
MIVDHAVYILQSLPGRICDVLKPWAEREPDRSALVEETGAWTYRQLSSAVEEAQIWLIESGVRPGDRVMIVCENCRAFAAVLLGLACLDAWPVLVNARLSAREVDQIREHCGARRVIYTTAVSSQAREHAARHHAAVRDVGQLGPIGLGPLDENVEPEPVDPNISNRVAALIYTSGTTGNPKGVMLTHQNVLFVAAISAKIRSLTPNDRLLGVLPMSHAVGLSVVLLGTLLSGAALYLMPHFDPMTARKTLDKEQITIALGTPAMFSLLIQYAKLKNLKSLSFPALRVISASGAPLHPSVKSDTEGLFGMVLHNGYGITECSPTIAQTRLETPRTDVSVGEIFPGVEIKLVGPDGKPVAEGEVGELRVHGPTVMKGYYRAPAETAAAIDAEGWFNTCDLARLVDGNLFIVGRTKELIVRSGFNVYPVEVEAVLNSHPDVARSAVIGRPHRGDEEVVAFVQLRPGSQLKKIELAEHAAKHLAPYKRPSRIILVTDMPMTPTGKVVKGDLRELAESG